MKNYIYNDKIGFIEEINIENINNSEQERINWNEFIYIFNKNKLSNFKTIPIQLEIEKDIFIKKNFVKIFNKKFTNEGFHNKITRNSFRKENILIIPLYYLLNIGFELEEIPFSKNKNYKLFHMKVPLFKYEELNMLENINIINVNENRDISKTDIKYWLPSDLNQKFKEFVKKDYGNVSYRFPLTKNEFMKWMLKERRENLTQWVLKELGYPFKIFNAAIAELRYKEFIVFGIKEDFEKILEVMESDEIKNCLKSLLKII